MQVTFAVLADYANVSREGKLNVMGIFDRVFARQLPARFPPMQLVIRLEATFDDLNTEHRIRVQLADPEGQSIFDINGSFTPRGGPPGRPTSINHVIRLADLPLRRTGTHTAAIWIDDDLEREVPLHVDQAPGQQGAGPADGDEPVFH